MMLLCTGLIRLVTVLEYISCSLVILQDVRKLPEKREVRCARLTKISFSAFIIMAIPWPAKTLFRSTAYAVPAAFLVVIRQRDKLILPDTFKNKLFTGAKNIPVK